MDNFKKHIMVAGGYLANLKNKQKVQDQSQDTTNKNFELLYDTFLSLKEKLEEYMEPIKVDRKRLRQYPYVPPSSSKSNFFIEDKLGTWLKLEKEKFSGTMDDSYSRLIKVFDAISRNRLEKEMSYVQNVRQMIIDKIELPGKEIKDYAKAIEKVRIESLLQKNSSKSDEKSIELTQAEINRLIDERQRKMEDMINNTETQKVIIDNYINAVKIYLKACLSDIEAITEDKSDVVVTSVAPETDKPEKVQIPRKPKPAPEADKPEKVQIPRKPKPVPEADKPEKVQIPRKPKPAPEADKPEKVQTPKKPNPAPEADKPEKVQTANLQRQESDADKSEKVQTANLQRQESDADKPEKVQTANSQKPAPKKEPRVLQQEKPAPRKLPSTIEPGKIVVVVKSFLPIYIDELPCQEGEFLIYIDQVDENWVECFNFTRFGILPTTHISLVDNNGSCNLG